LDTPVPLLPHGGSAITSPVWEEVNLCNG